MADAPAWRVFYADGDTFDDGDGPPEAAPARGVIAVVSPDPRVGRIVDAGQDYYCWRDDAGTFYGMDQTGLWDYLAAPGWKRVLFGRSIPPAEYRAIYRQAVTDADFPAKSAWAQPPERETGRPQGLDPADADTAESADADADADATDGEP